MKITTIIKKKKIKKKVVMVFNRKAIAKTHNLFKIRLKFNCHLK